MNECMQENKKNNTFEPKRNKFKASSDDSLFFSALRVSFGGNWCTDFIGCLIYVTKVLKFSSESRQRKNRPARKIYD